MKLISCHIENFGKIHDYSMDFSEGINSICQENGWGKSTLAAFIRSMFYGFDGERKRRLEENERKRYEPWQGGVYGGQLSFQVKGKKYLLSRIFRDKEANDEFELRDLETNLISNDYSQNIGEEIFKIDRESFLRTIFIDQKDCETSLTDDMNAKIGRLSENTNDINNFESADKLFSDLLNKMSSRRKTGSLAKRKEAIAKCQQSVDQGKDITASMDSYQDMYDQEQKYYQQLKDELKLLQDTQSKCAQAQEMIAKKRELERLEGQLKDRKTQRDECRLLFPKDVPTSQDVRYKINSCRDMTSSFDLMKSYKLSEEEKKEYEELSRVFAHGMPTEDEIQKNADQATKLIKLSSKRNAGEDNPFPMKIDGVTKLVLMAGFFLLVAGLIGLFLFIIPGIVVMGCGLILVVAAIFKLTRKISEISAMNHEAEKKQEAIENEFDRIYSQVNHFLSQYGVKSQDDILLDQVYQLNQLTSRFKELKKKQSSFDTAYMQYQLLKKDILMYLESYGFMVQEDIAAQLLVILENINAYAEAEKNFRDASAACALFMKENDVDSIRSYVIDGALPSLQELSEKIGIVSGKLNLSHENSILYKNKLNDLQEKYAQWEENVSELENLRKEQEEESKKYTLIEKTQEKLRMAKENITAKYSAPILESFKKYYQMITVSMAEGYRMDANINITVEALGKQREIVSMSSGYQDLIGICLRLALIDAMYQEEAPIIIMDDPFVHLDDQKMTAKNEFLNDVSEKYQIIYFTCSQSRC